MMLKPQNHWAAGLFQCIVMGLTHRWTWSSGVCVLSASKSDSNETEGLQHAGILDQYMGCQGLGPGPQTSRQTVGDDCFGGVLKP